MIRTAPLSRKFQLTLGQRLLIIQSLLIEAAGRSFAVPQDTIIRVLRVEAKQFKDMLQNAATGKLLRCNDTLFPLVSLADILNLKTTATQDPNVIEVLILKAENTEYALLIDGISDSEEIVVKNIPSYMNPSGVFGGATFMGDGTVGLIIDINGIADLAGIKSTTQTTELGKVKEEISQTEQKGFEQNYLLFHLSSNALYGIPLEQVYRLEEIEATSIQRSGAERVVIYRDEIMPILSVEKFLKLSPTIVGSILPRDRIPTIVAKGKNGFFGLEVSTVLDIATGETEVSDEIRDRKGIVGNTFIRDHNVTILDLPTILGHALDS